MEVNIISMKLSSPFAELNAAAVRDNYKHIIVSRLYSTLRYTTVVGVRARNQVIRERFIVF